MLLPAKEGNWLPHSDQFKATSPGEVGFGAPAARWSVRYVALAQCKHSAPLDSAHRSSHDEQRTTFYTLLCLLLCSYSVRYSVELLTIMRGEVCTPISINRSVLQLPAVDIPPFPPATVEIHGLIVNHRSATFTSARLVSSLGTLLGSCRIFLARLICSL